MYCFAGLKRGCGESKDVKANVSPEIFIVKVYCAGAGKGIG